MSHKPVVIDHGLICYNCISPRIMKKDIYEMSIKTRQLQLVGFGEKLAHFGIVAYFLIFPVLDLCLRLVDFVQGYPMSFRDGEIWFITIPLVLATITYQVQKQRLKYQVIKTNLKKDKIKELIIEAGKELEWEKGSFSGKAYKSRTNPGWLSGSWGEQITVLFHEDDVFINSICDLDKKSSLVSWGRNRRNVNTLLDKITKANQIFEKAV